MTVTFGYQLRVLFSLRIRKYRVIYHSDEGFQYDDIDLLDPDRRVHLSTDPYLPARSLSSAFSGQPSKAV